jgi:hypothetical protein
VQEKLEGQTKKQVPVYFVSEVLSLSKKNYTELEKVLYAVLMASKKLRHYFQAYHIIVPSSQPLKDIMRNGEATGRVGKWAAELNEFTIDYVHRSSIQSQVLADFIADWTPEAHKEETSKDAEAWTVFCDGSWGAFGAGLCGSHIGSRPLLGKVFRQGFYWPKAASDAAELVQKCEGCQKCTRDQKQPSSLTQLIQPTWPLQRWGLDLLGPLPPAQGNLKYVVVAVEYFSKWIEAKPLATITSVTVQKFFWLNIVCRFRVPKAITVDNGTQFDAEAFKEFCE